VQGINRAPHRLLLRLSIHPVRSRVLTLQEKGARANSTPARRSKPPRQVKAVNVGGTAARRSGTFAATERYRP